MKAFLFTYVLFSLFHMNTPKTYLALGDSYTIGQSVPETDRYPVQAAAQFQAAGIEMKAPDIIAVTGWTTADLLKATASHPVGDGYDLVTLLIGVNNQYQHKSIDTYKTEFTTLLQQAIAYARGNAAAVYVLSIPDYGVTPFARGVDSQRISDEIAAFNEANRAIADHYKLHYLFITAETRRALQDESLMASDGLHYSGKELHVWASMLVKDVLKRGILKG